MKFFVTPQFIETNEWIRRHGSGIINVDQKENNGTNVLVKLGHIAITVFLREKADTQ